MTTTTAVGDVAVFPIVNLDRLMRWPGRCHRYAVWADRHGPRRFIGGQVGYDTAQAAAAAGLAYCPPGGAVTVLHGGSTIRTAYPDNPTGGGR